MSKGSHDAILQGKARVQRGRKTWPRKAMRITRAAALIERATGLLPRLRERSVATNRARQAAAETVKDFWDADLWYLLKPKKFGGPEVRIDTAFEIASVLSKGDGSAAWVWTVMGVHDLFMAYFDRKAQEEYWANDRTLSASSFAPSGRVTPAPGGYKLSGKWSFCSGIDHAQWMLLGGIAGMLSQDPPIPDIRYMLLPKSDVTVIDDWHVMGLSGTGSKSCTAEDVFVPEHRMVKNADFLAGTTPGTKVHPAPLYKAPVWAIFPFCISSAAPGMAKGACEAFIAEMKARSASFDHSPLARKPNVQLRLSEASALADAAELLYMRSLKETIDKAMAGETSRSSIACGAGATRAMPCSWRSARPRSSWARKAAAASSSRGRCSGQCATSPRCRATSSPDGTCRRSITAR